MRRLINAFAIEWAVLFVFLWVNVPVYVSLQFMFGCLSFALEQLKKKNKFVSYYLFTMCMFQSITTNKNMKKWQTPQDVYNKGADQTVLPLNLMPIFIQPGMFYSF